MLQYAERGWVNPDKIIMVTMFENEYLFWVTEPNDEQSNYFVVEPHHEVNFCKGLNIAIEFTPRYGSDTSDRQEE